MAAGALVLGIDLDGVCADFCGGLRPLAAEWLGVRAESLTEEVTSGLPEWGIDRAPGGYEAFHRFAIGQRALFRSLMPVPGAGPVLRRLTYEHDVRIRVITQRLCAKYLHQIAIRQTAEWLDSHDIPYWDLCFIQDKSAVGADLYLEDSPESIGELRAAGRRVVVFTNATNRGVAGPRANSWLEVEALVLEEIACRAGANASAALTGVMR
jgi:5'(3')-deoxyribonucleotidase